MDPGTSGPLVTSSKTFFSRGCLSNSSLPHDIRRSRSINIMQSPTQISRLPLSINLLSSKVALEEVLYSLLMQKNLIISIIKDTCIKIYLDHQGLWNYYHQIQSAQYLVAYLKYQPSFPVRISSNIKEKIKANNPYSMLRITNKRETINQINTKDKKTYLLKKIQKLSSQII